MSISNVKLMYGAFVLSYIVSFAVIGIELLNSSHYSHGLLLIYILISICAMLCLGMGCVPGVKTRFILLCFVLGICIKGFMVYNIIPSIWDAGKLIIVVIFYAGIGWYPAYRWINIKYGLSVRIISSIAIGNIVFTLISTTCLSVFGLRAGGMLALIMALALCVFGLFSVYKNRDGSAERLSFTSEDAQLVGAIILILIVNAVFMNQQYPHGAPLGYLRFMQDVLRFDKFPPAIMYGGFEKNAHYAVLSVPPLLAQAFHLELNWTTYFELIVGLGSLLISVYIFSRLLIFDKHSTALFSMIFVALLGELHLYPVIGSILSHGGGIGDWLAIDYLVRSRTAPMFQPWGLAAYIDNGMSWATMLFVYYFILSGVKDKLALFVSGLAVMVIVGGGQEEVFYSFGLAGLFIVAVNFRRYFQYRWKYMYFIFGILSGMAMWVHMSLHSGSLQALGGSSGIFIRPISDWGLYLYRSPGTPQLGIPLANPSVLFSWKTIKYILSEWSMLAIFCYFGFRSNYNHIDRRNYLAITISLMLAALLPFFVGTDLLMTWNLNRFMQPLFFWLYIWAGVGFVGLITKLERNNIVMLMAGSIILLVAFYPTIHFANTQLILDYSRIQASVDRAF